MNPVLNGTGLPQEFFFVTAYDSLIVREGDGSYGPGLAASFQYTDDTNQVFEITLKEGIKFSDGEALDSSALKKWVEYLRDGPGPFAQLDEITDVEIVDDLTVRLHLSVPDTLLPNTFSQNRLGFPLSPAAIDDPDSLLSETFGAGPYKLDSSKTVTGQTYVYDKVPDYWNPDAQHWDQVIITVMTDPNAALSAMQSGQVDFLVGQGRLAKTAEDAGITVDHAPLLWDAFILMDRGGELTPALGDVRVRQALNYAVDRDAVIKAVFGEFGQPNVSMVIDGFDSFSAQTEERYSYDPDKARQLLTEAGYPDGFELNVGVFNRNGADETTFAQAVQAQLEEVGVKVNLQTISDGSTLGEDLLAKKYSAFAFFGQVEEANQLYTEQLRPDAGALNPFGSESPKMAELFNATMTASPEALPAAQQALQTEIVEQAYYLQVGVSDNVYFSTDKVTGIDISNAQPIVRLLDLRPAG